MATQASGSHLKLGQHVAATAVEESASSSAITALAACAELELETDVSSEEWPLEEIVIERTKEGVADVRTKADSLSREGRTQEAIQWLSRCISLIESREIWDVSEQLLSNIFADRANIYLDLEKWCEAEQDCNAALQLNQKNRKVRYPRAYALHRLGRMEDAFCDIQAVLKHIGSIPDDLAQKSAALKAKIAKAIQQERARLNYARYYNLDPEKVTDAQVKCSCAGTLGWLNASVENPNCRVLTLHSCETDAEHELHVSCVNIAGNNVATMNPNPKLSLQQFRRVLAIELVDHEMNLRLILPDGTVLTKADDSKCLAEILSSGR